MAERIHLLLVCEPGVDGVFRHVEGLADYLLARGHLVDLAYSSRRSGPDLLPFVERVRNAGGECLDLRVSNTPAPTDVPAFGKLLAMVRRRKPGLIHAHSSKAGGLVRLLPNPEAIPIFYTPHAYYGLQAGKHWRGRFYNRLERILGRRGVTINVSGSEEGFAKVVLNIPRHLRMTVPNGVDLRRFQPPTPLEQIEARQRLGLPARGLILGSVARLSAQKDPHTLYRAIAEARARGANVHLAHLGTGPNRAYAQELLVPPLRPHVTRIASLQDTRIFYHAIDGLISTSRYEGLSLVLLEALGCGLPLIVSNVGGNDDILRVRPSQSWAFKVEDHQKAADCVEEWVKQMRARLANNHRELAELHFDAQLCYQRIEKAYTMSLETGARWRSVDYSKRVSDVQASLAP